MKKLIVLVFAIIFTSGCEKDDICDGNTQTTPRMVIEFYDENNVLKNVTNLAVIAPGLLQGVVLDEATGSQLANGSKISIPLMTTMDSTRYTFVLNSTTTNPDLLFVDTVDFNYTRNEQYVSRACGFKTTYELNLPTNPIKPVVVNNGNPGNWIRSVEITETNIQNENEVHVKLFF